MTAITADMWRHEVLEALKERGHGFEDESIFGWLICKFCGSDYNTCMPKVAPDIVMVDLDIMNQTCDELQHLYNRIRKAKVML